MNNFRNILYIVIGIIIFIILVWLFAIPNNLIRERIEDSVAKSGSGNISLSIDGFKKGIFFTLHADTLNLKIDNKPALRIRDFAGNFAPRYLTNKELAFVITGKIGTGDMNGVLKLPYDGKIKIEKAELNEIPYLSHFGIDINGYIFSEIKIKNESIKAIFIVSDLNIDDSASVIPLLNNFHKLQGALSVEGNNIKVDSISLEGGKGYARLKGNITNGIMNLALELMPTPGKLNPAESMLIGKYLISPGYYVIPIKGPL